MTQYLSSIGPAVANHLWQSTAFAAAAYLVTLLLRRNGASVRYGIWFAASVKFLIPFSLLIGLGGLLPTPRQVITGSQTVMYSAMDAMGQPFSDLATEHVPVASHPSLERSFLNALPMILLGVWLCGFAAVLLVWVVRWRQVSATLRRAMRVEDGREVQLLRRVEQAVGMCRPIPLLLSRELMEPGIFGIFRPVLIWPEQLSERLRDEHIDAILAHELMHVRRYDNLAAAMHMVVEAAFWFHPMVWWMERRMIEERERACDEAVVEMGSKPGIYADSLLKACRFCVECPFPCVSGITGAPLAHRVRSIITLRTERLTLARKLVLAAFAVNAISAPIAFGVVRMIPIYGQILQTSGPRLSFEVAAIKPSDPLNTHESVRVLPGGRFQATLTARTLIEMAYGIRNFQLSGGPKWLDSVSYDIDAKSDDISDPNMLPPGQQDTFFDRQMLRVQSLLADRFHLKVHTAAKEMPVFALLVAKGGPKLHAPKEGEQHRLYTSGPGHLACYSASMSELAEELPEVGISRIVVDRTGLKGRYDFWIKWTPDEVADGRAGDASGPSIFTAMQDQLGLKLVPTRGPAEVLVIDHIERPSEN